MYSGSFDNSVIAWDIGGGKGTALELQGHHSKVVGLGCVSHSKRLFSISNDGMLGIWDMAANRSEVCSARDRALLGRLGLENGTKRSILLAQCCLPFATFFLKIVLLGFLFT